MRIRIHAVGRVRDPALREVCERYVGRVRRYRHLDVREVRDSGRPDAEADEARRIEANAILKAVDASDRVVALTRTGRALTSRELARQLDRWQSEARDVGFVVGGAHGLGDAVLRRADFELSLSAFTLPHELARLVLLEQVYRACTILRGEPYHKGGGG
jgi:23S rRNA (pseudouridine1915-N3)-methyltransferase